MKDNSQLHASLEHAFRNASNDALFMKAIIKKILDRRRQNPTGTVTIELSTTDAKEFSERRTVIIFESILQGISLPIKDLAIKQQQITMQLM